MRLKKKIGIIIGIILVAFLCFYVFKVQNVILRQVYPLKYHQWVDQYAQEYQVDDLFIYAMIKAESNYDPRAHSSSQAKGLMQLMDNTAQEIAKSLGIYGDFDLYDPETNIRFGTKYFSDLLKDYNNNEILALAAYNAGKGNLKKWVENGTIQADGSDIENIPFKETTTYIRKILSNYKMYQYLYTNPNQR